MTLEWTLQAGTVLPCSGLRDPNARVGDLLSHCLLRACTWLFLVALALFLGHELQVVTWDRTQQVSSSSHPWEVLAYSLQNPGESLPPHWPLFHP